MYQCHTGRTPIFIRDPIKLGIRASFGFEIERTVKKTLAKVNAINVGLITTLTAGNDTFPLGGGDWDHLFP